MWFKKKSVLLAENHYDTELSADGTTDMRTTAKQYSTTNSSISSGVPSAADANKYFYLPALGFYHAGLLYSVGSFGYYWSSSACPWSSIYSYQLRFDSGDVYVDYSDSRVTGFRAEAFQ